MGFDINQKHQQKKQKKLTGLLQNLNYFIHKIWRSPISFVCVCVCVYVCVCVCVCVCFWTYFAFNVKTKSKYMIIFLKNGCF